MFVVAAVAAATTGISSLQKALGTTNNHEVAKFHRLGRKNDADYDGMRAGALNPRTEYLVKNGKRTAVVLPINEYEELLEDLHDLAVIAERKDEPTIPLSEVKRRLRKNGRVRR